MTVKRITIIALAIVIIISFGYLYLYSNRSTDQLEPTGEFIQIKGVQIEVPNGWYLEREFHYDEPVWPRAGIILCSEREKGNIYEWGGSCPIDSSFSFSIVVVEEIEPNWINVLYEDVHAEFEPKYFIEPPISRDTIKILSSQLFSFDHIFGFEVEEILRIFSIPHSPPPGTYSHTFYFVYANEGYRINLQTFGKKNSLINEQFIKLIETMQFLNE